MKTYKQCLAEAVIESKTAYFQKSITKGLSSCLHVYSAIKDPIKFKSSGVQLDGSSVKAVGQNKAGQKLSVELKAKSIEDIYSFFHGGVLNLIEIDAELDGKQVFHKRVHFVADFAEPIQKLVYGNFKD